MKTGPLALLVILSAAFFSFQTSISAEMECEEYVYVLGLKGEIAYQSEGKIRIRQTIRRMELISPGKILEIGEGASVSLTCPGCKVVNLTHKDSPYKVKMKDFKKDSSTASEKVRYFTSALKSFVYPDSKLGPKATLEVRGAEVTGKNSPCKNLWPRDEAQIMPIGDHITFSWPSNNANYHVDIREFESKKGVHSEKTSSDQINVSIKIFKPGMGYEWLLSDEKTGERCYRTFELVKKEDSITIMETIKDIASLLPPGTDNETRCRLQAGYLYENGLTYDAWHWLESNGILQE